MYRARWNARSLGLLALVAGATIGCSPSGGTSADMGGADPQSTAITPDGNGAILAQLTVVNRYALLGADLEVGGTQITLAATTPLSGLNLRPNDLLLIYQAQGARIETRDSTSYGQVFDRSGAGTMELVSVESLDVAQNQITIQSFCGGLRHAFRAQAGTQLVRVPQYQSLLVAAAGSLVPKRWDGKTGGIIAVRVENTLTIDGSINATGYGFRGGASNKTMSGRIPNLGTQYRSLNKAYGGSKGEGIAGDLKETGPYGRGAPANGGGGGNNVLAGGGGGANGGDNSAWTGQGRMDARTDFEKQAWQLDPAYVANGNQLTTSTGGGRGGYSLSQAWGDPRILPPERDEWGGDLRRERGGLGGWPLARDAQSQFYLFGGGGGAGDNFQSAGGAGGAGGGLILLIAGQVDGAGTVAADGAVGQSTSDSIGGAGGGGGGGSIILAAKDAFGVALSAAGGNGGSQDLIGLSAAGPGGGGGGGVLVVATTDPRFLKLRADPGQQGFTRAGPMSFFAANGATAGSAGVVNVLPPTPYGGVPFCSTADLAVSVQGNAPATTGRDPVTYTIAVSNMGPSPAEDPVLRFTLAPTSEILSLAAPGWTCSQTETQVECARHSLRSNEASTIQVQARPPLGRSAGLSTARISSVSVDPNQNNDVAEISVDIKDPLAATAQGGGLSCGAATSARVPPGDAWGPALFLTLLGLLLRRRRAEGNK